MAKQIKIIEMSPEDVAQALKNQPSINMEEIELQQDADIEEAIINMTANEIVDYIAEHIAHTNVIVEALNITTDLNLQDSIFVASLNRSRVGLDAAILWIENHFSLNEQQAEVSEKSNITQSPMQQKDGKRIVYGSNKEENYEDDLEQL
jgi:hypothetical protein